jgi:hypothetical protein
MSESAQTRVLRPTRLLASWMLAKARAQRHRRMPNVPAVPKRLRPQMQCCRLGAVYEAVARQSLDQRWSFSCVLSFSFWEYGY